MSTVSNIIAMGKSPHRGAADGSDDDLYDLLDQFPAAVILLDTQSRVIFRNSAGKHLLPGIADQACETLNIPDELVRDGHGSMPITTADGSRMLCQARYVPLNGSHKGRALLTLMEEVPSDKDSARIRDFLDRTHIGIYRTTPSGRFLMANAAMIAMLGYENFDDIARHQFQEMGYHPDNPRSIFLERMSRDGEVVGMESAWIRKDGAVLYVRENARTIRDDEGNILYFEGTLEDVSERRIHEKHIAEQAEMLRIGKETLEQKAEKLKALNLQLLDSEQELRRINASKDMFFSILAHDLRSPFATIMGFSDVLVSDMQSLTKEELMDVALQINRTTHHVYNLLNNLLAWSRIQTGVLDCQPIKVDLCETVITTVNMFMVNAIKKRIEVKNAVPLNLHVWADKTMLDSILQNLVSNAIKFTREGGEVIVSAAQSDGVIEISVSDNGVGMTPDQLELLFNISHQRSTPGTARERGTGLGLILCHELVRMLGGVMQVESEEGKGSVFRFTVPIAPGKGT